jgi:hypothetical protein
VLAAEERAQLGRVQLRLGFGELRRRLGSGRGILGLVGELQQDLDLVERLGESSQLAEIPLERALLAKQLLGALSLLPQLGTGDLGLEGLDAPAQGRLVKGAPGTRRAARAPGAAPPRARWSRSDSRPWCCSSPPPPYPGADEEREHPAPARPREEIAAPHVEAVT